MTNYIIFIILIILIIIFYIININIYLIYKKLNNLADTYIEQFIVNENFL